MGHAEGLTRGCCPCRSVGTGPGPAGGRARAAGGHASRLRGDRAHRGHPGQSCSCSSGTQRQRDPVPPRDPQTWGTPSFLPAQAVLSGQRTLISAARPPRAEPDLIFHQVTTGWIFFFPPQDLCVWCLIAVVIKIPDPSRASPSPGRQRCSSPSVSKVPQ